jgi:GTP-binding protein EngB required for normal cell division
MVVVGNTNAGKSTFLNALTKMKGYFNTSQVRETSCIWRFNQAPPWGGKSYSFKKI